MIRFNFRKKLIKEDEFASQIVEILEEKLDDMKIKVKRRIKKRTYLRNYRLYYGK